MLNKQLLLFLFALLFGCDQANRIDNSVVVNANEVAIKEKLVERLGVLEIRYEVISETALEVSIKDQNIVTSQLNEIMVSILPVGRSISLSQPLGDKFTEALKIKKIKYEEVEIFNKRWFIWSGEDDSEVQAILRSI